MAKKAGKKSSGVAPEGAPDETGAEGDKPWSTLRVRTERAKVINQIASAFGIAAHELFERPDVVSFFNHLGVAATKEFQRRLESELQSLPAPPKPPK